MQSVSEKTRSVLFLIYFLINKPITFVDYISLCEPNIVAYFDKDFYEQIISVHHTHSKLIKLITIELRKTITSLKQLS